MAKHWGELANNWGELFMLFPSRAEAHWGHAVADRAVPSFLEFRGVLCRVYSFF